MKTLKFDLKRISILAAVLIFGLALTITTVHGAQKTPWHSHSSGVNLVTESTYYGATEADGKYKTKKGYYIKMAWVQINAPKNTQIAYTNAEVYSRGQASYKSAYLKRFNNPALTQSFPYGWTYW